MSGVRDAPELPAVHRLGQVGRPHSQQLSRYQEFRRARKLEALQRRLQVIAFVKDFLFGQQLNRCQEFNGGAELEALQSRLYRSPPS